MTVRAYAACIGFLTAVLAANYLTTEYGLIPVGFGLTATAGTYLAGLCLVLRDAVQDTSGRRIVVVMIATGALLSFLIAEPRIALASGVAFGLSELVDFGIYTPLRRRGYIRAAFASNVVGAFVDTVLFLWIAGFGVTGPVLAGQMLAKVTVTVVVVAAVAIVRRRRRERVPATT